MAAFEECDKVTISPVNKQMFREKKGSTDVWELLQVNNTRERGCLCNAGVDLYNFTYSP